jgi:predicted HTH transcriptional regulator
LLLSKPVHTESQHLEYKRELTDALEREVVGFLNSREGGRILIGVDDGGRILGLADPDGDQLKIKDRLKQNIQPSCLGLFDVLIEESKGKTWIKLLVASGSEKPYYLRKQGMSPRGCFLRIGSATEPMPERQIEALFAKRTRNSISRIVSPGQDLKFSQLKIYYEATGR